MLGMHHLPRIILAKCYLTPFEDRPGGGVGHQVELIAQLGQDLFAPPSVKGWDGDRGWLNTASMILRLNFASEVTGGRGLGRLGEGAAREMKSAARVDGLTRSIVRRPLIASTRGKIISEVEAAAGADRQRRVAWHMVVSVPEYQLG